MSRFFMPGQNNVFASRLNAVRKANNLKTVDLASLIGLGHTSVSKMEAGETKPSVRTLMALVKVLNVSADYLLGLSDCPRINHSEGGKGLPLLPSWVMGNLDGLAALDDDRAEIVRDLIARYSPKAKSEAVGETRDG
jgi:transcriptional regulator with XRE-family HTH domain